MMEWMKLPVKDRDIKIRMYCTNEDFINKEITVEMEENIILDIGDAEKWKKKYLEAMSKIMEFRKKITDIDDSPCPNLDWAYFCEDLLDIFDEHFQIEKV